MMLTDEILDETVGKTIAKWNWGYESILFTFTDGTQLAIEGSEWLRLYNETNLKESETFNE